MKIGVLNGQLNKWQAGIAWGKAPEWQREYYSFIHVWCIKLHSLPPQGKTISPENYKGVRWFKKFKNT